MLFLHPRSTYMEVKFLEKALERKKYPVVCRGDRMMT